jgi:hypothetical protein
MAKPAKLITPMPGTIGLSWDPGEGASQYWIEIGSAVGLKDLYDKNQGKNLSVIATGLPTTGTIYVRLWTKMLSNESWMYHDYSYAMPGITGTRKAKTGIVIPTTNPVIGES